MVDVKLTSGQTVTVDQVFNSSPVAFTYHSPYGSGAGNINDVVGSDQGKITAMVPVRVQTPQYGSTSPSPSPTPAPKPTVLAGEAQNIAALNSVAQAFGDSGIDPSIQIIAGANTPVMQPTPDPEVQAKVASPIAEYTGDPSNPDTIKIEGVTYSRKATGLWYSTVTDKYVMNYDLFNGPKVAIVGDRLWDDVEAKNGWKMILVPRIYLSDNRIDGFPLNDSYNYEPLSWHNADGIANYDPVNNAYVGIRPLIGGQTLMSVTPKIGLDGKYHYSQTNLEQAVSAAGLEVGNLLSTAGDFLQDARDTVVTTGQNIINTVGGTGTSVNEVLGHFFKGQILQAGADATRLVVGTGAQVVGGVIDKAGDHLVSVGSGTSKPFGQYLFNPTQTGQQGSGSGSGSGGSGSGQGGQGGETKDNTMLYVGAAAVVGVAAIGYLLIGQNKRRLPNEY